MLFVLGALLLIVGLWGLCSHADRKADATFATDDAASFEEDDTVSDGYY